MPQREGVVSLPATRPEAPLPRPGLESRPASPDWPSLVPVLFIAVGMLFVSLTIFRRAGPEMADVL